MPVDMGTNGGQGDLHDVGTCEVRNLQQASQQGKSIHDILWQEVCKDDELAKKNDIRNLGKINALELDLFEANQKSVGKGGNVEKLTEKNDVVVDRMKQVVECERHFESNYANDIESDGGEDEFSYENFCGFNGINDFENDMVHDFGHEVSEDDDTYGGDGSSSSDTEESVVDDYELTVYEKSQIGDDDEELCTRGAMYGLDGLDVLDGPSERPFFSLGMTFLNRVKLWKAVADYAITNGYGVKILNNERRRFYARCQDGCPYKLYAPIDKSGIGYVVTSINHEHRCTRIFKNPLATYKWVAEYFKEKVQENPRYPIEEMRKELERDLKLHVSKPKVKRARKIIRTAMEGSYWDDFSKLEAYCNALRVSNPGNDVSVEIRPDDELKERRVFRRMYVCFFPAKVIRCHLCRRIYLVWFYLINMIVVYLSG